MSEAEQNPILEALLADALKPVDPPERLTDRVSSRLSAVADAAATELNEWADEVADSELDALRDPRNWVRPVVAVTAGSLAGGALLLFELRRRRKQSGWRGLADDLRSRLD